MRIVCYKFRLVLEINSCFLFFLVTICVVWLMKLISHLLLQTMIGRLLLLLQDPDYRARLFLAQRIGVLFQTWDGHEELFQDIWCGL